MMKYFLALAVTLFTFPGFGQHAPTGSIKSITLTEPYAATDLGLRGNVKTITEIQFNTKRGGYDEGGPLTLQYDEKGNLIESKTVMMFSGVSMGTVIKKYVYNNSGKLEKLTFSDPSDKKGDQVHTFRYNAKGNMIALEDVVGGKLSKTTYEYDDKNRMIVQKDYRPDATNFYHVNRYTYDDLNRITMNISESMTDKKTSKSFYTYSGKMPQVKTYSVEGYDAKSEYEYNTQGDIVASNSVTSSGKQAMNSTTFAYEYDANGNWTKKTISGLGAGYVTRKIEYYTSPAVSYKKDIQDISTGALQSFGKLVQDAYKKASDKATLLDDEKKMIAITKTAIEKLKKVPEVKDNNAKKLTLELLQYTIEASTLRKIEDIINGSTNYEAGFRELALETGKRRKEIMTELGKLNQ